MRFELHHTRGSDVEPLRALVEPVVQYSISRLLLYYDCYCYCYCYYCCYCCYYYYYYCNSTLLPVVQEEARHQPAPLHVQRVLCPKAIARRPGPLVLVALLG